MFKKKKVLITPYSECYNYKVSTTLGTKISYICFNEYDSIISDITKIPHTRTNRCRINISDIEDVNLEKQLSYNKETNQIIRIIDIVLHVKNYKYDIIRIRHFDTRQAVLVCAAKSRFFGLFKTSPVYVPSSKFDNKEFRKKVCIYDLYKNINNSLMTTLVVNSKLYKKCIKRSLSMNNLSIKHELCYEEEAACFNYIPLKSLMITSALPYVKNNIIHFNDACNVHKNDIERCEFTSSAFDMLMLNAYKGNLYTTNYSCIHIYYALFITKHVTDNAIIYSISYNEVIELFNMAKKKCEDVIRNTIN